MNKLDYKKNRNRVVALKRQLKKLYFQNSIINAEEDSEKLGETSDKRIINCGMPRGSIPKPLLFIIYINDLCNYLQDCQVNLYADYTVLYYSASSHMDLLLTLRLELTLISDWRKAIKLTLNTSKTKFVVFGSRNKLSNTPKLSLTINRQPIEQVTEFKYLGF